MKTEEKAKAYDRAIERAKRMFSEEELNYLFPELAESDDERIRKEILNYIDKATGCKRWVAWLEKQGEQEEPQVYETKDGEIITYSETDGYKVVEPKFKVGDWIVFNGLSLFIKEVIQGYYRTISVDGIPNSYGWDIDNVARLWNISDVKEGDVLVDSLGNVCIYQEPSTKLMYHSHCYGNHKFFIPMGGSHEIVGSYPATKEQRDKFEKSMDDAGYTFDFEKKELKEIKPKFKVGDEVITKNEKSLTITKIDEKGYWSDDLFICNFDCECDWDLVEQKPDDKVEPKFKVGDYVVDNCGYVWRIEGIINQFYILEGIDGGESRPTIEWVNKTFHLWDITEDAKNGDVLASKDEKDILIFRRIEPSTSFSSYYNIKGRGNYGWCDSYFIPATKEQRDKLEKSMADAGYVFDFDKKKLKKIEQKPADEVEPKFHKGDWVIDKQGKELKEIEDEEYNDEDYGIDGLWHAKNILEKSLGKVDGYQTDDGILDHKCAISSVSKLYKEDAKIKNRWKPSEEQIYWLKWAIGRMTNTEKGNEAEAVLKDLLEQLEKL